MVAVVVGVAVAAAAAGEAAAGDAGCAALDDDVGVAGPTAGVCGC